MDFHQDGPRPAGVLHPRIGVTYMKVPLASFNARYKVDFDYWRAALARMGQLCVNMYLVVMSCVSYGHSFHQSADYSGLFLSGLVGLYKTRHVFSTLVTRTFANYSMEGGHR